MHRDSKLCLVIPSLQAGGMERVMAELANYYAGKDALEVNLVLYGITREVFYSIPESVKIFKPDFEFNNYRRLTSTLKTLFFIRNTIKKINPDSILSFGEYWNSFVLIALFRLKYPIYVSDRCQPDKSLGRVHNLLRKFLYPKATGIIAQTEKAREIYIRQRLNNNIAVIGNPIRKIENKNSIIRENIILTVGRLISSKHHDKLIETFLNISNKNWKLVIVGYDHLKQKNSEKLKQIIADHNAVDNVILAGKQSDVDSFYLKSKVFAFTSSSEGFPNVIGEAMSAGLPVIAFDCVAGPSDMIENNENGFLIRLFDYDQFQIKLALLMENEDLRIKFGEQSQKDITNFSIEKISVKIYNYIMSHKLIN